MDMMKKTGVFHSYENVP